MVSLKFALKALGALGNSYQISCLRSGQELNPRFVCWDMNVLSTTPQCPLVQSKSKTFKNVNLISEENMVILIPRQCNA